MVAGWPCDPPQSLSTGKGMACQVMFCELAGSAQDSRTEKIETNSVAVEARRMIDFIAVSSQVRAVFGELAPRKNGPVDLLNNMTTCLATCRSPLSAQRVPRL